ncbi:hypothetical protein Cs7R123_31820 [Catellatospora sp. TT07R-123]|nr:hypothetical protein Cs7R123_31820 [Catellatospora sp. TT07R-123]
MLRGAGVATNRLRGSCTRLGRPAKTPVPNGRDVVIPVYGRLMAYRVEWIR